MALIMALLATACFWHFLVITFQLFILHVWLRITDEGSVPEMRIWSILLIKSDLKWCIQLRRSPPVRARGVKSRMCPPYPQRDRKRRLNGAVCRNHRIKRVVPCRCLDGHVKEPCEMSMAWEPDRRFNFFFNPPAHLCAVTYITEIS